MEPTMLQAAGGAEHVAAVFGAPEECGDVFALRDEIKDRKPIEGADSHEVEASLGCDEAATVVARVRARFRAARGVRPGGTGL